jgi:hypothetical protein
MNIAKTYWYLKNILDEKENEKLRNLQFETKFGKSIADEKLKALEKERLKKIQKENEIMSNYLMPIYDDLDLFALNITKIFLKYKEYQKELKNFRFKLDRDYFKEFEYSIVNGIKENIVDVVKNDFSVFDDDFEKYKKKMMDKINLKLKKANLHVKYLNVIDECFLFHKKNKINFEKIIAKAKINSAKTFYLRKYILNESKNFDKKFYEDNYKRLELLLIENNAKRKINNNVIENYNMKVEDINKHYEDEEEYYEEKNIIEIPYKKKIKKSFFDKLSEKSSKNSVEKYLEQLSTYSKNKQFNNSYNISNNNNSKNNIEKNININNISNSNNINNDNNFTNSNLNKKFDNNNNTNISQESKSSIINHLTEIQSSRSQSKSSKINN